MQRRTYEGPMEWEYQGTGPVDATSPFTHLSQGKSQSIFSSPARNTNTRPNPNPFQSPSKPLPPLPPQQSFFSPRIQGSQAAPSFRNPAFTTPRKPFDDFPLSEASGAETSPGLTETSDFPNDTPDIDRMSDANMGTITPSRVDKTYRYGKSGGRRHAPGRGEIPRGDALRKRKRHLHDKDVRSVRRRQGADYEGSDAEYSESESDESIPRNHSKKALEKETWFSGIFRAADDPNFSSKSFGILKVLVSWGIIFFFVGISYSTVSTIKTDIQNSNAAARMKRLNEIAECTKHYQTNLCVRNLPALQDKCEEWKRCMEDDPDMTFTVRNSFKELANIINEFSGELHWKSWVFVFAFTAMVLWFSMQGIGMFAKQTSVYFHQSHQASSGRFMPQPSHSVSWHPLETPSRQRHYMLDDASDTDERPRSPFKAVLPAPPQTPSGRRSPSKEERARSPTKYARSPSKRH